MGRGRGRGGRGGSRGGKASVFSDDDEPSHPPSSGGGGGGSAGLSRNSGVRKVAGHGHSDLSYTQSVPKFLQPYGHLLQKGDRPKPRARVDVDDEEEEHDKEEGDADVTLRALEDNPELAEGVADAQVKRLRAEAAKERGNEAFKAKDYPEALKHYSEAIKMDNTNSTYYSNRAAVHAHLEDWEASKDDARMCVSLRGTWAKGWVRLGHALSGLEEWAEAKEAFSRAREIEPDDQKIEKAWQKADYEERQANQSGRVTFKARAGTNTNKNNTGVSNKSGAGETNQFSRRRNNKDTNNNNNTLSRGAGLGGTGGAMGGTLEVEGGNVPPKNPPSGGPQKPQKRAVLSFGDSDEDDQDDGG